ncbi:hypothetical protein RO3G_10260 [Rhizopus delemar RA 99-880]|uniref:Uncharacterized protein n=1 Tax=Rhizopus delemar (strain RA 99-880 / ATCC MYA-4621 / FGSC 9543 / NRRL 43880) TaxID=246409 RepID=I1CAS0_RHIO9|nr:hypothetical protein RO3G_10260 [Rhizopus delemar RA 99-880]|eukprot:EIE85550.1 hypothetical protein RO3G_10260 [Rhizopus delemar RA 99-880]
MSTMNVLSSIGVSSSRFSKLLCSRFYAQIVRPQMEYDMTINCFNHTLLKSLEETQDKYIRQIYGVPGKTPTKKEVGIYDGALVGYQMELPNPALTIPTTTCQDVMPSAA